MFSKISLAAAVSAFSIGVAGATLPAHASTRPAGSPAVVVTPAQAAKILAEYTVANNRANATYDIALQDKHEEGAARSVDDGYFRVALAVGLPPIPAVANEDVVIAVPRQTHYPAVFLTLAHPKLAAEATADFVEVLVFERDSAAATWKVEDGSDLAAGSTVKFAVDKDGYVPALVPSSLSVPPDQLYPAWITAQNKLNGGSKPSPAWAYNTLLRRLLVPRVETDLSDTATSAHFAPVCVASVTGALCVASTELSSDLQFTPAQVAAGARLNVATPGDRAADGGLPLGSYTSAQVRGQRDAAIEVPRLHGKGGLQLEGIVYQATSGTGTLG